MIDTHSMPIARRGVDLTRKWVAFDIETDGLLDQCTRIHCITAAMAEGPVARYVRMPGQGTEGIEAGLRMLAEAELTIAHNGFGFDIPAIKKLHPDWSPKGQHVDSLAAARVVFPEEELKHKDWTRIRRRERLRQEHMPKHMAGRHSLAAWGWRLQNKKGESPSSWETCTQEMVDYCAQDTALLRDLVLFLLERGLTSRAAELEQEYALCVQRQRAFGFPFDKAKATELECDLLARRAQLDRELRELFDDFEEHYTTKVRKEKKTRVIPFNPGSRHHIARALKEKHSWKPRKFTRNGQPKLTEDILKALPYPEAPVLAERFLIVERLKALSEGQASWIDKVQDDGRIRCNMQHNAAVTSRCTHSGPNLGNVTAVDKPWGREMRELFIPPPDWVLVGVDASGLEMRCQAHYMARHDEGEYVRVVLDGDPHQVNADAIGCDRKTAKTFFYALVFGAQDPKLGSILGGGRQRGAEGRANLMRNLPALGALIRGVQGKARKNGRIRSLDGRLLWVRKEEAAFNTLLQGAGALVMKLATIWLHRMLDAAGLVYGEDWGVCIQVHDEWQMACRPGLADKVANAAIQAIRQAGVAFEMRIPMDGDANIGANWAETH